MLQCFRENVLSFVSISSPDIYCSRQILLSSWLSKIHNILQPKKKKVIYKQVHAKSPVSQCIYRCWNCQASKKPSYIGQKPCFSQEKKKKFISKILPSGSFQINFFVFCLKEKLFHWNRFDIRKYKECDLISLLGKDALTEDIYTWIRLSAQQGISFDPTMK